MVGLGTHDTATPLLEVSNIIVVHQLARGDKLVKLGLVFLVDLSQGKDGRGLLEYKLSQTGLSLNDAVRDIHLAAEGREPDNQLNRVDIVGNDNKLGLLLLNQVSDVVKSEFDGLGFLTLLNGSVLFLGFGLGQKTVFLLGTTFGAVVREETEEGRSLVLVQGAGELVDAGRHLQALLEDGPLALKADVLGPSDVAAQITLGGERITSSAEILGGGLEKVSMLGLPVLCNDRGFLGNWALGDFLPPR